MTESMIETVARLKELEAKATPREWEHSGYNIYTKDAIDIDGEGDRYIDIPYDEYDTEFLTNMRNAAPALLDVLGEVREGDAEVLDFLVRMHDGEQSKIATTCTTVLRRYQALAAKMEETR